MGLTDNVLAIDRSIGGLNQQPDYRPLAETALNGGVQISPDTQLPSAYGVRSNTDIIGRYAGMLQMGQVGQQLAPDLALSRLPLMDQAVQQFGTAGSQLQPPSKGGSGGILGDITGALGDVAHGIEAPFKGVLHASDWLYNNAISMPIATTMVLMSDGSQWKGGNGNLITGLAKMLHPDNWAKAYQLRQENHLSPGQAFFLAWSTDDIFNQSQIAKSMNSPWFHLASGLIDAGLQWELNPLQLAGGAVSEFSKARWFAPSTFDETPGVLSKGWSFLTKGSDLAVAPSAVFSPADQAVQAADRAGAFEKLGQTVLAEKDAAARELDAAGMLKHHAPVPAGVAAALSAVPDESGFGTDLGSEWERVMAKIHPDSPDAEMVRNVATAKIAQKMFATDPLGAQLANGIVNADNANEVKAYVSATMGAQASKAQLMQIRADLGADLLHLNQAHAYINELPQAAQDMLHHDLWNNVQEVQTGIQAQMDRLSKKLDFIDNLARANPETPGEITEGRLFGSQAQFPHQSIASRVKGTFGGYLQGGPFDRLVRIAGTAVPRNVINVNAEGAESRFGNLLKYIGSHSEVEQQRLVGQFAAAEQGGRMELVQSAQEDGFKKLLEQKGLPTDNLQDFVRSMRDSNGAADGWRQQLYDNAGRDVVPYVNPDGTITAIHQPLYLSQTDNTAHVYNWQEIHSYTGRVGQYMKDHPGIDHLSDIPGNIVDGFHQLWKPAVLINPRTTARIITQDGLYSLSKIHSVADAVYMTKVYGAQVKELAEHYSAALGLNRAAAIEKAARDAGVNLHEFTPEEIMGMSNVYGQQVKDAADRYMAAGMPRTSAITKAAQDVGASHPRSFVDIANMIESGNDPEAIARNAKLKAMLAGGLFAGGAGYVAGGPTGALIGAGVGGGLGAGLSTLESTGVPNFKVDGTDWQASVSANPDYQRFLEAEIKQGKQLSFIERDTSRYMDNARKTGEWAITQPGTQKWGTDIERVLNFQIGQDPLMRQILNGSSDKEIVNWIQNTRDGQQYMRQLPFKQALVSDKPGAFAYVGQLRDHVDAYTMGNDGIKAAALNQKFKASMMTQLVDGDPTQLPGVHGEIMRQVQGSSNVFHSIQNGIDKGFAGVVGAPVDELARMPGYHMAYKQQVEQRLAALGENASTISATRVDAISEAARRAALADMKQSFYNAGDRTDLQYILRGFMPFLPSTQKAVERLGNIALDNPQFAARVRGMWAGLSKVNFEVPGVGVAATTVKDENGNDLIRFRVPSWAAALTKASPFFSNAFDTSDQLTLNPKTISMLTAGGVMAGPLVQLAASEVEKLHPSLEQSLKFLTPFGPNTSIKDTLNPLAAQRLDAATSSDQDSKGYRAAWLMVFGAKMAKMQLGEIPQADMQTMVGRNAFLDSVTKEAQGLYHIKAAANLLSPMTVGVISPFQPLIDLQRKITAAPDAYRNKLADGSPDPKDDRSADEIFYDLAGDEYAKTAQRMGLVSADPKEQQTFQDAMYWLTAHSTKNIEGLPPTVEAVAAREKFGKLIDAYPQLGAFIAGKEGTSEGTQFSQAAYEHQLSTRSGNSGLNERVAQSPSQILNNTETSRGWLEYSRAMDVIDSQLFERQAAGGPVQLSAARNKDLQQLKTQVETSIGQKYPSWWEAFNTHDDLKDENTISGFKAIVSSSLFAKADQTRPEMPYIREYLDAYDTIKGQLEERKQAGHSGALNSNVNRDLQSLWSTVVADLKQRSTDFAPVYHRYLERIVPTVDPLEMQAAA